jgi:aquaporin Z
MMLTGFAFGCVGCLVTLSPVGKISGAHINPAVSVAFWLRGLMGTTTMIWYIISQMAGAVLGCIPLLLWGGAAKSIEYGITHPGSAGLAAGFIGEVITTAGLITVLYLFIGTKTLRNFTPYTMPLIYGVMAVEVPYSGCSTNPARSFGPAVIAGDFSYYWLYWVGPLVGVVLVTLFFRYMRLSRVYKINSARVSYYDSPTPDSLKMKRE